MSVRSSLTVLGALAVLIGALTATAQTPAKQPATTAAPAASASQDDGGTPRYIVPETPEQRKERLATQEDPGPNPDDTKVWWRFGKPFRIFKHEKSGARFGEDPKIVRPIGNLNMWAEIYQVNDKYVWVWVEDITEEVPGEDEPAEPAANSAFPELNEEAIDFYMTFRKDFEPLDVPKSEVTIKFEESSEGLPTGGSWRNSLAVADVNGDGNVDLIMPPQRGPASAPAIVLGDGKGKWTPWKFKWPRAFNYGSVVAADFNKDKHIDLAFGVHLTGVAIFLGNSKGEFREVETGVRGVMFPTRRVIATDVDRDGWMDVVAITEGPIGRGVRQRHEDGGNLRAFLNRKKGEAWETVALSGPKQAIGGDWLAVANLNGDQYPDFVGASVYFGGVSTIQVSKGKLEYDPAHGKGAIVPFYSYYYALTAGRFSSRDRDDAIVSYFRAWPRKVNPGIVPKPPLDRVIGLDRISFAGGQPKRTPIMRWEAGTIIRGMGRGDFDRDGKQDVLFTRFSPREAVVLLGDGSGGFRKAMVEGVNLAALREYDLTIADVNKDDRPDLVIMYESASGTAMSPKNGRVQVFLNRGPVTSQAAAK